MSSSDPHVAAATASGIVDLSGDASPRSSSSSTDLTHKFEVGKFYKCRDDGKLYGILRRSGDFVYYYYYKVPIFSKDLLRGKVVMST